MSYKTIELTDEIRDEEPVGYLVFLKDQTINEYKLLVDEDEARRFAEIQGEEKGTWPVYPLYATHPIRHND